MYDRIGHLEVDMNGPAFPAWLSIVELLKRHLASSVCTKEHSFSVPILPDGPLEALLSFGMRFHFHDLAFPNLSASSSRSAC